MMAVIKAIDVVAMQSEREIADIGPFQDAHFLWGATCVIFNSAAKGSSKLVVANSLYRYPSPDRPANSPSRPMTETCRDNAKNHYDIGYHGDLGIAGINDCVNCDAHSETTIGLRLCKRHQSSLQQWQYSVWQAALTTTWSAAWPARVQALLLRNCLALTAQVQWLLAQLPASFVTTQASLLAAKLDTRAHRGRTLNRNRRRGLALAAVLRFGD
jgi:hypothetical protein